MDGKPVSTEHWTSYLTLETKSHARDAIHDQSIALYAKERRASAMTVHKHQAFYQMLCSTLHECRPLKAMSPSQKAKIQYKTDSEIASDVEEQTKITKKPTTLVRFLKNASVARNCDIIAQRSSTSHSLMSADGRFCVQIQGTSPRIR